MNPIRRHRVAIYSRVSTEEQASDGISIHQQPKIAKEALDRHLGSGNYDIVGEYSDAGLSGSWGPTDLDVRNGRVAMSKKCRPGLSEVVQLALDHEIDVVACINPSRLYRRDDGVVAIQRLFRDNGVKLVCDQGVIDLDSPEGLMVAGVLGAVFNYQRSSNNLQIKQMIGKRKDGGEPTGTLPYGWRYPTASERESGITAIVPVSEQLEAVCLVKDLYLRGYSEVQVARELNRLGVEFMPKKAGKSGVKRTMWDQVRVSIVLKNVIHTGYVTDSNGMHIKGRHHESRAYDYEDYLRIQEVKSQKRRRPIGLKSERPEVALAGIPKCGSCGETLHFRHTNDYLHFRCPGLIAEGGSRHVLVRADVLEKAVLHEVERVAQSKDVLREVRLRIGEVVRQGHGDAFRERDTLEARKAKLESQVEEALRQLRECILTEAMFRRQMSSIDSERVEVESRLATLSAGLSSLARIEDLERRAHRALESFPTVWKHLELCEKTRLLETVVEKLVIEDRGGHSVARIKLRLLPEKEVRLPRMNAPKNSKGGGGIETLTESEMAALWHLSVGHSPSQGAAYMKISRSTFSTLTSRAGRRMGEASPARAAKRAKQWINRIAHLLPLYEQPRVRFRNAKRPPVIRTAVLSLAEEELTAAEISERIGIDLARVCAILQEDR